MKTVAKANADTIALYLFGLLLAYIVAGKTNFTIFLDNANTHKKKMKTAFANLVEAAGLEVNVEFVHIPAYSPYLNAAEYFIHLIRHKYLRHLPVGKTIEEVVDDLIPKVDEKQILTPKKMATIIRRIKSIPRKKPSVFMTEWE